MRLVLQWAVLGWLAFTWQPAETSLEVRHRARALSPGEVVLLEVKVPQGFGEVQGEAFGRPLPFFRRDSSWQALVGIDLQLDPGSHSVRVVARDSAGASLEAVHELRVHAKSFPTRHLEVEPRFVDPPPEVLERIRREGRKLNGLFAYASSDRLWNGSFLRPVDAPANSSFGKRSIFNGKERSPHSGADFSASAGALVWSPADGRVVLAEDLYFSGNTVIIDHGLGLYSLLAHLSEMTVFEGELVAAGDAVGKVGATGRVTGSHLHWSVRLGAARVDPLSLIEVVGKGE